MQIIMSARNFLALILSCCLHGSNTSPPQFNYPEHILRVSVNESVPVGSVVVHVRAEGSSYQPGHVNYSMLAWRATLEERENQLFEMDSKGVVKVKSFIDLESPHIRNQYKFKIEASNIQGETSFCWLIINIKDINDNFPIFSNSFYKFKVLENVKLRTTVGKIDITDKDKIDEQKLKLAIKNEDRKKLKFDIDSSGRIFTVDLLDREKQSKYAFDITATDSIQPIHVATASVEIYILDENDSEPRFEKNEYRVKISENSKIGTEVVTVQATDLDVGFNGEVTYNLMNYKNIFSLDSGSGQIKLVKQLDYERRTQYNLLVRAQDAGDRRKETKCQVIITVTDENDNYPIFNINPVISRVPEDAKVGQFVTFVSASDKDGIESLYGRLQYHVQSDEQVPFKIDRNTGRLSVGAPLDRETRENYTFDVIAVDGGQKEAKVNVRITVLDVNDSIPKFRQTSYSVKLAEDAAPGTNVFKIRAYDTDKGDMLNYAIVSGNDEDKFFLEMVSNGSANLLLGSQLEYSKKTKYLLKIKVTDQAQHSSFTIVNIHIQDKNSHAPKFIQSFYSIKVYESVRSGEILQTIQAEDLDSGENAHLTYMMHPNTDLNIIQHFSIDQNSGSIKLLKELDNEKEKYYSFQVICNDNGIPQKSDTASVEVGVLDVNDNAPIFDDINITLDIPENFAVGSVLTTVKAQDADESRVNESIEYKLSRVEPPNLGFFTIDKLTGIIRLRKELDRERTGCYELEVTASDHGTPSLSSKASVTIRVTDINDNAPYFENTQYLVSEDKPVGSIVARIEALDKDIGDNANLEYFIINDGKIENIFYLDPSSGDLELRKTLDFETQNNYTIKIQVFSGDLQTTQNILIKVLDVNDNKPQISDLSIIYNHFISLNHEYTFSLVDDLPYSQLSNLPIEPIGVIPHYDPDRHDKLTFGQIDNGQSILHINSTTGQIKIGKSLDANVEFNPKLKVYVDDGANREYAYINIEVKIINEDTLSNSIMLTVLNMDEKTFLEGHINHFRRSIINILSISSTTNVLILSMTEASSNLKIIVAARRSKDHYVDYRELNALIYLNYNYISPKVMPLKDWDTCSQEPCENYKFCHSKPIHDPKSKIQFSASKHSIIGKLELSHRTLCSCPMGYAPSGYEGDLCLSPVNVCWMRPCKNDGTCYPTETGYYCKCKEGTRGKNCEHSKDTGRCSKQYVELGGPNEACGVGAKTCTNLLRGGYQCECNEDIGNTDEMTKYCDGYTRSFEKKSFAMFRNIENRWDFVIQFSIKTVSKSGIILFNESLSSGSNMLVLKLVSGRLHIEFSTNGQNHTGFINNRISTGKFESVRLSYRLRPKLDSDNRTEYPKYLGKSGVIFLTLQTANCLLENKTNDCSLQIVVDGTKSKPGLDLTGPLFIGGRPHPGDGAKTTNLAEASFVGCIKELELDGEMLDLIKPLATINSELGCKFQSRACNTQEAHSNCSNGAKCLKFGQEVICNCSPNFMGDRCDQVPQNVRRLISGYLKVSRLSVFKNVADSFEIHLQLRTVTQSSSVITWDGFELFLYKGFVGLKIKHVTKKSKTFLADSDWHQIVIRKDTTAVYILVDNIQAIILPEHILAPKSILYIGDKNIFQLVGCVANLTVHNKVNKRFESPKMTSIGNIKNECKSMSTCEPNTCPNGAECIEKWNDFECRCPEGLFGPSCQKPCSINQCFNGGICIPNTTSKIGFACKCPIAFTGERCEREAACPTGWSGTKPGECRPCNCTEKLGFSNSCQADDINKCECKENYYRPLDSPWKCIPCHCDRLGAKSPNCSTDTGACQCRPGVLGLQCDKCSNKFAEVTLKGCESLNQEVCPRQSNLGVQWSRTKYDHVAHSLCPEGSIGNATRKCLKRGWSRPNLKECLSKELIEFKKYDELLEHNEKNLTTKKAGILAHGLYNSMRSIELRVNKRTYNVTNQKSLSFFENDLNVTFNLIHKSYKYQNTHNSFNLTMTIDNEFNSNQLLTTAKLIRFYATNSHDVKSVTTLLNDISVYCDTIAQNIHRTYKEKIKIIADKPEDLSFLAINGTNNGNIVPSSGVDVVLDRRLLDKNVKLSSAIFTSRTLATILPLNFASEKNGFKVPPNPVINSAVVSLALCKNGTLVTSTPKRFIKIRFLLLESFGRSRAQCVYWSTQNNFWSPDGCFVTNENKTHVECQCQHFSTYSVLMDQGEMSVLESSAIRIVVVTAICITIIVLTGYSLTFLYLTEIRSSLAHIHNCLAISLTLCNIIFLCGIDAVENQYLCMIAAIGLHYSWLAVFSWTAIESFHLYRRLSQPQLERAQRADRQAIQLYYSFGLGIPAVITATSVGLQPAGYGNARFCWLDSSDPLVGAMIIPIIVLFLLSILIIIFSIRLYLTTKKASITKEDVKKDIRLMGGKIPLLLLSVLTLLAAVNNNSAILYIMYLIFQLIVALFIVIFYLIQSQEFRNALKLELTKKERRRELKSATQLSAGITYNPSTALSASASEHKSRYPFLNNTSSSEMSKPTENVNSSRHSTIYKVKQSESDCSEDGLLRRKTRKANKRLQSINYHHRDNDKSSQSGLDSENRRPKIKWHDQNEKSEDSLTSLKVVSKNTSSQDDHDKPHNDDVRSDDVKCTELSTLIEKQNLMKRQKSILKNKAEAESYSQSTSTCDGTAT